MWGDVNQTFLSMDRIENTASALSRRLEKGFSQEDFQAVSKLITLAESLSNPVEINSDPRVQGLFAAISFANGQIGNTASEGYLNANAFGVPNLPTIGANGGMTVTRATGRNAGASRTFSVAFRSEAAAVNSTARQIFFFVPIGVAAIANTATIPVPSRPYGYGTLPGLSYLASLRGSVNYPAWNEYLEIADRGVMAFKKFARIFRRVIPNTPLTESKNVPQFLRSTNDEANRDTMLWISVIDKSPFPFMVRQWTEPDADAGNAAETVASVSSIQLQQINGAAAKVGLKKPTKIIFFSSLRLFPIVLNSVLWTNSDSMSPLLRDLHRSTNVKFLLDLDRF